MKYLFIAILILLATTVKAQRIQRDTLIISDTSIHFITIGNQTFKIKRSVLLQEASPFTNLTSSLIWGSSGSVISDSLFRVLCKPGTISLSAK